MKKNYEEDARRRGETSAQGYPGTENVRRLHGFSSSQNMERDPIYKVVDLSVPTEPHIFVFLGQNNYDLTRDVLEGWKGRPKLDEISKRDHRRLVEVFGPDWDLQLGMPGPSPWAYQEEEERPTSRSRRSRSRSRSPSARARSKSPSKLQHDLRTNHLKKFQDFHRRGSRTHWVYHFVPLTLFPDDTVTMLRAKIYCAQTLVKGRLATPPEWQMLSYRRGEGDMVVPGMFLYERNFSLSPFEHESTKEPEIAHPYEDFYQTLERLQEGAEGATSLHALESVRVWEPIFKLSAKQVRIEYVSDVLWTTKGEPVNRELTLLQLPLATNKIRQWLEASPIAPLLQEPLRSGFLQLYLPIQPTRTQNLLNALFRRTHLTTATLEAMAKEGFQDFCTQVREDNRRMECVTRIQPRHRTALALNTININLRSPFEEPGAIPIREIFDQLEMERGLVFAQYFGPPTGRQVLLKDRLIKIHTGPETLNDRIIDEWLVKKTKEDYRPNELLMKLSYPHIKNVSVAMNLMETGKVRLNLSWVRTSRADMNDVALVFRELTLFIEQVIHPIVKSQRDGVKILPSLPHMDVFYGRSSTMELTKIDAYLMLEEQTLPNYDQLRPLMGLLSPFFEAPAEVSLEHWKQDPVLQRLSGVMQALQLPWTIEGLSKLIQTHPTKEWGSLPESEAQRLLRIVRQKLEVEKKTLKVIYRRYNGHQGTAHIKRFLYEYIQQHKKSVQDLRSPDVLFRVVRQVMQKYHLSPDDARDEVMMAIQSMSGDRGEEPRQLRFELKAGSNMIVIRGLKNFRNHSSIIQLLQRIDWLFSRLVAADVASLTRDLEKGATKAGWNETAFDRLDVSSSNVDDTPILDDQLNEFLMNAWLEENTEEDALSGDLENIMAQDKEPIFGDDEEGTGEDQPPSDQKAKVQMEEILKDLSSHDKKDQWKLERLYRLDPDIFYSSNYTDGKRQKYSRRCTQARQPLGLTPEEYERQVEESMRINGELPFKLPKAVPNGFKYRGNYYICPPYWCDRMARAVAPNELRAVEKDARGNITAGLCPDGEPVIVNRNKYEYPSFYNQTLATGEAQPCCLQEDWSTRGKRERMMRILTRSAEERTLEAEEGEVQQGEQDMVPIPDIQRRYVMGPKKDDGVGNNRFAHLDPALDRIFNDDVLQTQANMDLDFRRVLRMGVLRNVDPMLACCLKLYNLYRVQEGLAPLHGERDFRYHLATHLTDEVLITSLGRGKYRSEFEYFVGYDYRFALRSHLLQDKIQPELLWELCARPLSWLFPRGLALTIFERPSPATPGTGANRVEPDTQVVVRCPPPHIARFLRQAGHHAFLLQLNPSSTHVIVDIEPVMQPRPFFAASHPAVQYVDGAFKECAEQEHREDAMTADIVQSLQEHDIRIEAQWMHGLNRLRGLVLGEDAVIIPLPGDPGVVADIPITRHITYPSVAQAVSVFKRLSKRVGPQWTPTGWAVRYETGPLRIGAIELQNGLLAPVLPTPISEAPAGLPRSRHTFVDVDEDLWREVHQEDDRIRAITDLHFTRQLYEQFLREVSGFLRRELTMMPAEGYKQGVKSSDWRRRYWFIIYEILQSKRTLSEKQNAIVHLFTHGLPELDLKPLLQILVSHDHVPDLDRNVSQDFVRGRQLCFDRPTTVSGPRHCLQLPRCTIAQNKCKLYIPRHLRDKFLVWFVEDLLRNRLRRMHILSHRWNDSEGAAHLEITPNMLVFDASMIALIHKLVKNPDEVNRMVNNVYDTGPTGGERRIMKFFANRNLDKLKSKGEFGTILRSLPATLQPYLPGFLVRQSPHILQNLWYLVSHLQFAEVPSEHRFRTQLIDYLQTSGTYQVYLQRQKQENIQFRGIRSLTALREFFLSDSYTGTMRDLDLVANVFPLNFYILRTSTRGAQLQHRICSPLPGAMVSLWLLDTQQEHLEMLVKKVTKMGSSKASESMQKEVFEYKHIFQLSDLPEIFMKQYKLSTSVCSPYRMKGSPLLLEPETGT